MEFHEGDLVTRNSYKNDVVFKILSIRGEVAYLKGTQVRLYADAPLEDLTIYEVDDRTIEEDEMLSDRFLGDYFYLPGKVLHIDGDKVQEIKVA